MKPNKNLGISLLLFLMIPVLAFAQKPKGIEGIWKLIPDQSTEIPLFNTLKVTIKKESGRVLLTQKWGAGRSHIENLDLKTNGSVNEVPVTNRVWPTNVFMGLSMATGSKEQVRARWENSGKTLKLNERYKLLSSQGEKEIKSESIYALSEDGNTLTITITRSTLTGAPIKYVMERVNPNQMYYMDLTANWKIDGDLPSNAFLISLQGVVNMNGPRLYFKYPKNWPFTYTSSVKDFYEKTYHYDFKKLDNMQDALQALKPFVKGYIVWDKSVRTSLIVAFTAAGLDSAVVVTPDMIPMMKQAGLKEVANFQGKFEGMNDYQITKWAYDQYGSRCNKDLIVWMGGVNGDEMQPGIADFGIYKHAFFSNLSTVPTDTAEYKLANEILAKQKRYSICVGWHDYFKDLERNFVTLMSHYAIRVIGLNTLPNVSFSNQIKTTPGFKFKNHHNIVPGKKYKPEKKVYITCVQTDGLGLGSWLKPGRGEIPYAWEVSMNYYWLAPAMMEYFYTQATPNDYFIGSLSGPGYMYPKAIPAKDRPKIISIANDYMHKLDLNVFEVMDYSQGATVEGNTELPKNIVDEYYKYMPDAIGFLNGYAPAHTFAVKNGRPFISYDYYLSPSRTQPEAVQDLKELAAINSKRPYFLLMHVRESSDILRVKRDSGQIGIGFQIGSARCLPENGRKPTNF